MLALFERVEGEERIDFERDILHYGRRAEGRMLQLLHADSRSLVMRAMDALAKMGSVAAGDSIARLLQHPEPWLRISAAHAVGEIGAAGAAAHLVAALDDTKALKAKGSSGRGSGWRCFGRSRCFGRTLLLLPLLLERGAALLAVHVASCANPLV